MGKVITFLGKSNHFLEYAMQKVITVMGMTNFGLSCPMNLNSQSGYLNLKFTNISAKSRKKMKIFHGVKPGLKGFIDSWKSQSSKLSCYIRYPLKYYYVYCNICHTHHSCRRHVWPKSPESSLQAIFLDVAVGDMAPKRKSKLKWFMSTNI